MPLQKSDLFIVAMKPVKVGRAKGEMDRERQDHGN
jgi:hypothetical protein